MKIVCSCDLAINTKLMEKMKQLERFGAEVELFDDDWMQTPKQITEVMLKTEQEGADASPANPKFVKAAADAHIIVVHAAPVNTEVIEHAPNLKYIFVLRSGIENVNKELCDARGIRIVNAPGRSTHSVADTTVGLMIAENKNIARGHQALKEGKWVKQFVNFDYVHDMRKCTVGIIGAGQVGRKVITRLQGFGCRILVYDPYVSKEELEKMGYTAVSLEELLKQSDFVSLHLRLSETTQNFMDKKEFAMMKKTAYFINTARAGLCNEEALVEALKNKQIGGAALDVFNEEPLGLESPFLSLDNVTITPHVAGTSVDTFSNSVEIIYDELVKRFENGELNF